MSLKVAITMAVLMCTASVAAVVARPKVRTVATAPNIQLDAAIPRSFPGWREEPSRTVQVVNPQLQAVLDKLYSQTLTRTYVDDRGYRVMLSLAYGDDQRGGLQACVVEGRMRRGETLVARDGLLELHGGGVRFRGEPVPRSVLRCSDGRVVHGQRHGCVDHL